MNVSTPAEQLLFTTVRLEVGTADGDGAGTAFVFSHERDGKTALFLVTNKHVIAGTRTGRFFFTLSQDGQQPLVGQRVDIAVDDFEAQWYGHPSNDVDVAVMPLVPIVKQIQDSDGGGSGIRTHGPDHSGQRFSRPPP